MSKNRENLKSSRSVAACSLLVFLLITTALTSCSHEASTEAVKADYQRIKRVAIKIVSKVKGVFTTATREASSEEMRAEHKWAEGVAIDVVSKISREHPRIYLTPDRIQELRMQLLSTKADYFGLMKARMRGHQAALFYALDHTKELGLPKSREEYGRIAAEALINAIRENNPRASPDDLAPLYDWAHGALTADEKKAYVNFCRERLGSALTIHDGKHQGYRCSPSPQGIIAALSFYGDGIDDDYAKKLLTQGVRDTLIDNLAMEHVAGSKGGFADGLGYFTQLGGTFYPFLALGIATNSDFFFEHEVIAKMPNHLLYAMLPFRIKRVGWDGTGTRYFATFHDNWTATSLEYGSSGNAFANMFAIVAAEYRRQGDKKRAGLYMWLMKELYGGIPYLAEDPVAIVLMDWSIKAMGPKEVGLPLAGALGWNDEREQIDRDRFGKKAGIGWISMRSSWEDPDATFAIFKAEPFYYYGHMHRDSLSFMLAKGEELVLPRAGNYMCWYEGGEVKSREPGWPQMENFFSRTISGNTLLILDPGEKYEVWTNDGGERVIRGDPVWNRSYNGTANGNYRDIGGLIRFEQAKNYVYAAADATRAYNSALFVNEGSKAKVKLVQREFVYLGSPQGDRDCFVILDRVESTNPDFKKLWLLQLRARPEFDGSHRVVVGSEAGGIHLSEDTSSLHVKQERAELFVQTLLPKSDNRVVRRLGGWVTTHLKQRLRASDDGPLDIEVASTEGLPEHPVVIITDRNPLPEREVFDRFSIWPKADHATGITLSDRVCYFCDGRTPPGSKPAKLLKCYRATKSSPGFDIPAGARVIQEFRHMGIEGIDRDNDSERIDYPWGYGLGYGYGDGNQYGLWRVEVSPKKPSHFDAFLHVLHPTLKGKGTLKASLIESDSGNMYGALVGGKAVIFSKTADAQVKGSYNITGSGTVWQMLCDLKPGLNYQIKQDGRAVFSGTASKQGTIQFDSKANGAGVHFEFSTID